MAALLPGCPVFLTGMMGSGKSTIAPLLAAHWQVAWIDLDARVQRLFGSTIPAMFARGERYFRECESQALRSLMAEPGVRARTVVVATGGGVVVDPKKSSTNACCRCGRVPRCAGRLFGRAIDAAG